MNEWIIKPSYKLDLACFCNLFTREALVNDRHQEAYAAFSFILKKRPDLVSFASELMQRGIIIGVATASLLSLTEYQGDDIEAICRILQDSEMQPRIESYLAENGLASEASQIIDQVLPVLADMLYEVHNQGFASYWKTSCLPRIESVRQQFLQKAADYPVISKVNDFLGFQRVKADQVTLYLCCFNAPYGVGLKDAFISDIRWSFHDTVAVALHELIHPPFSREKIKDMAAVLKEDHFLQEAKSRLPASSGYHLPENFLEENLVEGSHLYLGEKLGVVENPLKYLLEHDHGSHVLSAILYDALKQGYREQVNSLEAVVWLLLQKGILKPGRLRRQYVEIYTRAGMADQISYEHQD